ncbi:redoxin domain-containing protein [Candidatus Sumerlaeota bacterium]|nr:redoxin domain-containing protein [Candidatus Sumerlaeota bacterium]
MIPSLPALSRRENHAPHSCGHWFLVILFACGNALGAVGGATAETQPPPAPDFELPTAQGGKFRLSQHSGMVRVLLFTRDEGHFVPNVLAMIERVVASSAAYKDTVLVCVIAASADQVALGKLGVQFRLKWIVVEDRDQAIHRLYKVIAVPTVVLVDKQGLVIKRSAGYTLTFGAEFRAALRRSLGLPMLKESSDETTATRRSALYLSAADVMIKRGVWSEALRNYQNALEINPELHAARLGAGFCLLRVGSSKEAAVEFQRLHAINVLSTQTEVGLLWARALRGEAKQAQTDLEKLRATCSNFPEYHEAWAAVYQSLKEDDKARQAIEQAEQLRGQRVRRPVGKPHPPK